MTKIALFWETTKGFLNKIAAYIGTGSALSGLNSYILSVSTTFFREKYLLIISLSGMDCLTLNVRDLFLGGTNKKTSKYVLIRYVPVNTGQIQTDIHFSKKQTLNIPVQGVPQWYASFLKVLQFLIYTPFFQINTTSFLFDERSTHRLRNRFLNKRTGSLNFCVISPYKPRFAMPASNQIIADII